MVLAPDATRILFVCTGNICRSPTAEGVFRHLAVQQAAGDRFMLDSAGTAAAHTGEGPDPRAVRIAKKHGIDIAGLRARAVGAEDFFAFDYIFAMDSGHLRDLRSRAARLPEKRRARIEMFLDDADVPDPWYGSERDFAQVFDLIYSGAAPLMNRLLMKKLNPEKNP